MLRAARDRGVRGWVEWARQWEAAFDRRLAELAEQEFEQEVIRAKRQKRQQQRQQEKEKRNSMTKMP